MKLNVEFVSAHRNRTRWPNPCSFEVPWANNNAQAEGLYSLDPISDQAPLKAWQGTDIDVSVNVVSQIDDVLVLSTDNALSTTTGYYSGAGYIGTSGDASRVEAYDFLGQSGSTSFIRVRLRASSFAKAGDSGKIRVIQVPNTLFVPLGESTMAVYANRYLFNESLGSWVVADGYDGETKILSAKLPPTWSLTDRYSIRKELPLASLSAAAGSTKDIIQLQSAVAAKPGQFVRVLDSEEIRQVVGVSEVSVTVNPSLSDAPRTNAQLELLDVSRDNYISLMYPGNTTTQREQSSWCAVLVTGILPNKLIKNGGYPTDYPFLYVELSDIGSLNQNTLCSNNGLYKSLFRATTSLARSQLDRFVKYSGDRLDRPFRFKPTGNFRVVWRLPTGAEIEFATPDTVSPYEPDPSLQTSVQFSFHKNC